MKKIILISLSLILTNFAISQVFGKYVPNIRGEFVDDGKPELQFEKWLKFNPETVVYNLNVSPVGVGKAFQLLDEILAVNDIKRKDIYKEKSIIEKGLDRWDYQKLYYSLMLEKSEINSTWGLRSKDGELNQTVILYLTSSMYSLMIIDTEKTR